MDAFLRKIGCFLPVMLLLLLFSCTTMTGQKAFTPDRHLAYRVEADGTLPTKFAPVFVIENDAAPYNRIGTPSAELTSGGKEHIFVDPEKATVYARQAKFKTEGGSYTNLIYRVHFEKVPSGIFPFHLGKGNNVGVLVVVTLNEQHEPVLFTTVHTCGCYLAFIPTSFTPAETLPDGWQTRGQSIHSENLPGWLDYGNQGLEEVKVVITIRDGSHRVKGIELVRKDALENFRIKDAFLQPMDALENLPLENRETTSFYEASGPRRGYVKGSHKTRERIFMSWWALDWRIGEDKKLGESSNDGIVFYTSLKPWRRESSDLRDFPGFLEFWKWKL